METFELEKTTKLAGSCNLPPSKSLVNRALILQANYPQITISQTEFVKDIAVLQEALTTPKGVINVGAAGTAMRFATAYWASKPGAEVKLTGSARMQQRPIGNLVDALNDLGAQIDYVGEAGFPPIRITGKRISGGVVTLPAETSSQFISALLLVAPTFAQGLSIHLAGNPVSKPYINMTIGLLRQFGVAVEENDNVIHVHHLSEIKPQTFNPEPDWSSAAFWYAWLAGLDEGEITLPSLQKESQQGDSRVAVIYRELGVQTIFQEQGVLLQKKPVLLPAKLVINLNGNPDLAQPLAVTCAVLGIGADFRGLQTLPHKETNRLQALKNELAKVGVQVRISKDKLAFDGTTVKAPNQPIETYEDHRMAMAFSALATRFPVEINNPQVVEKSYPEYWNHLQGLQS